MAGMDGGFWLVLEIMPLFSMFDLQHDRTSSPNIFFETDANINLYIRDDVDLTEYNAADWSLIDCLWMWKSHVIHFDAILN